MKAAPVFRLAQLAERLALPLHGDGDTEIRSLASIHRAGTGDLSFVARAKFRADLATTGASALIIPPDLVADCPLPALESADPYLTYARLSADFDRFVAPTAGIHPSAVVAPGATIDASAWIGPNCTVADGVSIGARSCLLGNSFVGEGSVIGEDCLLHPTATVYHGVTMGDRVTLHAGAVIGADGFGFAPCGPGQWQKIHQIGGVSIGDDVDIGACTTVDRGALEDTVIGNRVILDNHVQIAHNCVVGDGTAMAGCAAMAGSSKVGENCIIAGGVGIIGHIEVAAGTQVSARTLVTKSITEAGSYSAGVPMSDTASWRRNAARFTQLDDMAKRLRRLEKALAAQQKTDS